MDGPKDIAFVKVDILDFARHFIPYRARNDYEGAGKEVLSIADALVSLNPNVNSYAAKLIEESVEFKRKKSEAGRMGGLAKAKNSEAAQPPTKQNLPKSIPPPRNKDDVFDFAAEKGIPDWAVIDWWQQNYVERAGHDKDGNRIANWKGALINYYKNEKTKGNENNEL